MILKEIKRIVRVGNACGIVIPKVWLKILRLKPGDEVEIGLSQGKISIRKTREVVK